MNLIYITGIGSLIIQIITAILDFYVLNLNIPINLTLLKELLLEMSRSKVCDYQMCIQVQI